MIRDFKELTEDFKIQRINTGFHFMDNESSAALKMSIYNKDHQVTIIPLK